MQSLSLLLDAVAAHGGQLVVHGDGVKVLSPTRLPADLLDSLREHKAALRDLLTEAPPPAATHGRTGRDNALGASETSETSETPPRGRQMQVGDVAIDMETARAHLTILLTAIHEGCRRGLARHLERTDAEIVRSLLTDMDAGYPDLDGYRGRCQKAGAVVALAGLVTDYRTRRRQVEALGGDIFPDAAALELALLWQPADATGKREDGAV